ncbi:MAG TPA: hypothetical protein VF644_02950 [Pyrinomonadaceae bacterium]|jgi:hypothetical protein
MPGVDVFNLIAVIVSLVALIFSIFSLRVADRAARNDVLAQVRDWGGEVIEVLSEASGLCSLDSAQLPKGELFMRRFALICRFSALWDRGRLFFPNTYREVVGVHKPRASRGLRPPILDLLALSYELAKSIDYETGTDRNLRRLAFIQIKKEFVSAIQDATSFSAPTTVKKYEIHLTKISVEPLPEQIRILAGATTKGFQIEFDPCFELASEKLN